MKRIREKWNGEGGASILLALLLFLVCMMVAASVLMAAASNAGKLRSNREEHQKYLTLSSAVRLICAELEGMSYQGNYTGTVREVTKTVKHTAEDGTVTTEEVFDHYQYAYVQGDGAYSCGLNNTGQVLPLLDRLDYLFGEKLEAGAGIGRNHDDEYAFTRRPLAFTFPINYTLTVDAGEDFELVTVAFSLRKDGVITLTAALPRGADGHICAMEAELTPTEPLDRVFVLEAVPPGSGGSEAVQNLRTREVRWQLNWIAKKEAETP